MLRPAICSYPSCPLVPVDVRRLPLRYGPSTDQLTPPPRGRDGDDRPTWLDGPWHLPIVSAMDLLAVAGGKR
jgi:hypothetical protein